MIKTIIFTSALRSSDVQKMKQVGLKKHGRLGLNHDHADNPRQDHNDHADDRAGDHHDRTDDHGGDHHDHGQA